jgi:hypothetical protein
MTKTMTKEPENNSVTENKLVTERDERGRFLTGNNGGGRPKGSRNKLGEQFITDLQAEWQKSGATALERMAKNDPSAFVKVVAQLQPKELDVALTSDIFRDATNFAQAFRMARSITAEADAMPLIELQAEEVPDE